MKAKVTISRQESNRGGKIISISIEDSASGLNIVKVALDTADFAECLTGLSRRTAEIQREPTFRMVSNLGMKKEVKDIFVEKSSLYGEEGKADVLKSLTLEANKTEWDGWELGGDGLGSQQNGPMHRGYMCRYVEVKD